MIIKPTPQNHKKIFLLFFLLLTLVGNAQIGIGTVTPNTCRWFDGI
jgi:hypothetical protein